MCFKMVAPSLVIITSPLLVLIYMWWIGKVKELVRSRELLLCGKDYPDMASCSYHLIHSLGTQRSTDCITDSYRSRGRRTVSVGNPIPVTAEVKRQLPKSVEYPRGRFRWSEVTDVVVFYVIEARLIGREGVLQLGVALGMRCSWMLGGTLLVEGHRFDLFCLMVVPCMIR